MANSPVQITEQTAIILRHMLRRPNDEHTIPDICEAQGMHPATVRQNMRKLIDAGWLSHRTGQRTGVARERVYHMFTDEGRSAARAEVKLWDFTDHHA